MKTTVLFKPQKTIKILRLKFRGIDSWNRPVFKDIDSNRYYGFTLKLFSMCANEEEVINYAKNNLKDIEYFGTSFGCEPHGGNLSKHVIPELITN